MNSNKERERRIAAVRGLMAETFGVPEQRIGVDTRQSDVAEWDSVGHLNLMLGLEDTFELRLDVEEMGRLTSVEAILDHLETACLSS